MILYHVHFNWLFNKCFNHLLRVVIILNPVIWHFRRLNGRFSISRCAFETPRKFTLQVTPVDKYYLRITRENPMNRLSEVTLLPATQWIWHYVFRQDIWFLCRVWNTRYIVVHGVCRTTDVLASHLQQCVECSRHDKEIKVLVWRRRSYPVRMSKPLSKTLYVTTIDKPGILWTKWPFMISKPKSE